MHIKVEVIVRRVAKGKLEKARFYAAFRVSQLPIDERNERSRTNERKVIRPVIGGCSIEPCGRI